MELLLRPANQLGKRAANYRGPAGNRRGLFVEGISYVERDYGSVEIRQHIMIGRASEKPIVLGKEGAPIKAIGDWARAKLSEVPGRKVHLFLHVKVEENWAEDREI